MKKKENLQAYAFLSPFLVLVTLLYILPAVLTVIMAFTGLDKTFVWKFVGLKNFQKFFNSYQFTTVVGNTLKLSAYSIFVGFPFPIMFALMLNTAEHFGIKSLHEDESILNCT